MADAKDFFPIV
jgi:hypothetical protein